MKRLFDNKPRAKKSKGKLNKLTISEGHSTQMVLRNVGIEGEDNDIAYTIDQDLDEFNGTEGCNEDSNDEGDIGDNQDDSSSFNNKRGSFSGRDKGAEESSVSARDDSELMHALDATGILQNDESEHQEDVSNKLSPLDSSDRVESTNIGMDSEHAGPSIAQFLDQVNNPPFPSTSGSVCPS
ncbi:hypothetical protein BT96DRAFT_998421 [Gymnopus androsaceus JB14]|uniref:Uncharacterized protein n=1 Tax=Gymnopus androsaceus JB14 TaxID=1447944 RepID=A0A6A4H9U4_9AGAR|nr:hypothetical protein BT96DRAFT_998421 [Gymnopus androsaceus JB14]